MAARRLRLLLATTVAATVFYYGLSGHGLLHFSSHDGMAAAAAGFCLLLAGALRFAAVPRR